MMRFKKPLLIIGALLSGIAFNARATLTSYSGADGIGLVYSSVSNVTWTRDANLFKTLSDANPNLINLIAAVTPIYNDPVMGVQAVGDDDFDTAMGLLSWWGAEAFTNYLNSINYGGSNQWTLPSAGTNPRLGYNKTGSNFGQLFYTELGGTAHNSIPNTAVFNNEQSAAYLAAEYAPYPVYSWAFNTSAGEQFFYPKGLKGRAWVVSPGQVPAAVPLPSAAWLMGGSLLGLAGMKRRS
ncbi:VPLPA-CTERM sorting domain-containing protein [Methylomonas sp. MED-D]|uniref:VPLPA-CTERM sorting domain-containing protein n=1 Tax=unclassified Methylomonas TaxID=2608980 RepID=UPI0028A57120|nr:VPLPA-CTERM sorting domain-containing protein [Methylomonas sp. MV1]MDT4330862.1 VPLPA-CTERM sorting domain-containing protein [Methylomonas sp. MV1]